MISTIKKGIVIKKIPFNEKHEILYILLDSGILESFFYENGKKNNITVPSQINIIYFKKSNLNKVVNIDIENNYTNIVTDVEKFMYFSNIIELITLISDIRVFMEYSEFENIVNKVNQNMIDIHIMNAYFICKLLKNEGFKFKYKKNVSEYSGYNFSLNSFTDDILTNNIYILSDKLIKLVYILTSNDSEILEKIFLNIEEYIQLLSFLNKILIEYVGIETKSYRKICEFEDLLYDIERNYYYE